LPGLFRAHGKFVATARATLEEVAAGREAPAWAEAQALAHAVLGDAFEGRGAALASAVLARGPFAMFRAVDLAELVLKQAARVPRALGEAS